MAPLRKLLLPVVFLGSFLCNGAMAYYIDFTDSSLSLSAIPGGFEGSIDGIGFELTSTNGTVTLNKDGGYDGSSTSHCNPGGLACNRDGVGIRNDEVTMGQTLNLIFDTAVHITSIEFLDLYKGTGRERATVTTGGTSGSVDANLGGTSGDGGYAKLDFLALVLPGQNIAFTAPLGSAFWDDRNNDYALAAITVSAVPIPAAAWLFGTALLGFIGFSRRTTI